MIVRVVTNTHLVSIMYYICNVLAKQKHPRCKKARPSRKCQSAMHATKRVISGGGQGPSCCIFQKAQSHINYGQQMLYKCTS